MKKWFKRILISILILLLVTVGFFYLMFQNEISTLTAISQQKDTTKTQWSVVYNLTNKTATYVIEMDYDNPIVIHLID